MSLIITRLLPGPTIALFIHQTGLSFPCCFPSSTAKLPEMIASGNHTEVILKWKEILVKNADVFLYSCRCVITKLKPKL